MILLTGFIKVGPTDLVNNFSVKVIIICNRDKVMTIFKQFINYILFTEPLKLVIISFIVKKYLLIFSQRYRRYKCTIKLYGHGL